MTDLKGLVDNVRRGEKIKARRREISDAYVEHAATAVQQERSELDTYIDEALAPLQSAVLETLTDADTTQSARTAAQAAFGELAGRARTLAAELDAALPAATS